MIMMRVIIPLLLLIGGVCCVPVDATAQDAVRRIFLDENTVQRGYRITSSDASVAIILRPASLAHPAMVTLERLASQTEAEQRFPIDKNKEFASGVYVYDIARTLQSEMKKPIMIDVRPSAITPWTSLYFFDRPSQQWKRLETKPISNEQIRAISPLPFAPIAVLHDKKTIGSTSLGTLLKHTHSLLVVDGVDRPLIAKSARLQSSLASITKLMTALVFLEHNPGWTKTIAIDPSDDARPARIPFAPHEVVTTRDLFMGMLVGSNNNAARALARSTDLSEQEFVRAMNTKALEYKMYHTTFADTSGLDSRNISTVEDVVRLSIHAFQRREISDALATKKYVIKGTASGRTYPVTTTNVLLASASSVKGKTGYIDESGYNFVGTILVKKKSITVAVFGAPSSAERFDIVRHILRLVQ